MFGALVVAVPNRGVALEPLTTFVEAARRRNLDIRESRATLAQVEAQQNVARNRLFPSVLATGGYTRNQVEVVALIPAVPGAPPEEVVFVRRNQLDARLELSVPLVDFPAIARARASRATEGAEHERAEEVTRQILERVVAGYYDFVGAAALVLAAEQAQAVAEEHRALVESRIGSGLASPLDLERARADVAAAEQSVAEARLGQSRAARVLRTLTGLSAREEPKIELPDALEPEVPLTVWQRDLARLPSVRAADRTLRAADLTRRAGWWAYAPRLEASGSQRFTNAPGFAPRALWAIAVAATWQIDAVAFASARADAAAMEATVIRAERARRDASDRIEDAWNDVDAMRASLASAGVQAEASRRAYEVARDRYVAGLATQLEVLEAARDAFSAEVSRIRAAANLASARARLRLAAGREVAEAQ